MKVVDVNFDPDSIDSDIAVQVDALGEQLTAIASKAAMKIALLAVNESLMMYFPHDEHSGAVALAFSSSYDWFLEGECPGCLDKQKPLYFDLVQEVESWIEDGYVAEYHDSAVVLRNSLMRCVNLLNDAMGI